MVKEMFIKYEAPEMEVVEVEVEKGFASSLDADGAGGILPPSDEE